MKTICPVCLNEADPGFCAYCMVADGIARNEERNRNETRQDLVNSYFLPAAIFAASGWIIAALIFFLK